jgi:hypothetical protein
MIRSPDSIALRELVTPVPPGVFGPPMYELTYNLNRGPCSTRGFEVSRPLIWEMFWYGRPAWALSIWSERLPRELLGDQTTAGPDGIQSKTVVPP